LEKVFLENIVYAQKSKQISLDLFIKRCHGRYQIKMLYFFR
jgi:hypothetical protein